MPRPIYYKVKFQWAARQRLVTAATGCLLAELFSVMKHSSALKRPKYMNRDADDLQARKGKSIGMVSVRPKQIFAEISDERFDVFVSCTGRCRYF